MKEGSGPVNPPTHPPWVVLASYHIASTTACPGIAPCPVPDHIRALSRAGSLSSTHLLFGGLFPFFFPLYSFFCGLLFPLVKPSRHLSSRSHHQMLTECLMWPSMIPCHCHQHVGVLDIQLFLKGRHAQLNDREKAFPWINLKARSTVLVLFVELALKPATSPTLRGPTNLQESRMITVFHTSCIQFIDGPIGTVIIWILITTNNKRPSHVYEYFYKNEFVVTTPKLSVETVSRAHPLCAQMQKALATIHYLQLTMLYWIYLHTAFLNPNVYPHFTPMRSFQRIS